MLQRFKIQGQSMYPALKDGQYVLTEKLSYIISNPKSGDIVVLKDPIKNLTLIKRIVGEKDQSYFVAGDNQSQSYDSRNFGLVPKKNILSKVLI